MLQGNVRRYGCSRNRCMIVQRPHDNYYNTNDNTKHSIRLASHVSWGLPDISWYLAARMLSTWPGSDLDTFIQSHYRTPSILHVSNLRSSVEGVEKRTNRFSQYNFFFLISYEKTLNEIIRNVFLWISGVLEEVSISGLHPADKDGVLDLVTKNNSEQILEPTFPSVVMMCSWTR